MKRRAMGLNEYERMMAASADKIRELQDRVKELEGVLKPFASVCDEVGEGRYHAVRGDLPFVWFVDAKKALEGKP